MQENENQNQNMEVTEQAQTGQKPAREYVAFISYRHTELDKKVAKKVHYMVEHYVIPKELRGKDGKKKLGHVFRDEEELPVSSNLTASIETALDHSKFLIVICTPNLPKSLWCEREIKYFIEKHGRENVIGILVDGTPDESFPKPLTQAIEMDADGNEVIREVEPLAANLTDVNHKYKESRLRKEAVRLYAALLRCPFDSLWQREKRQKMRKGMALMALGMVIALAFGVSIWMKNQEIVAINDQLMEKNEQISKQSREIQSQYDEIQKKNADLRRSEAAALINGGELEYESGNVKEAAGSAIRAVASKEGREEYAAEAEYLLNRSLAAGAYDNRFRTVLSIEQETAVESLLVSDDGSQVFSWDDDGYVRCFSTEDGTLLWKGDTKDEGYHGFYVERQRMHYLKEYGILLVCSDGGVSALSLEDGSLVWSHDSGSAFCVDFAILSEDRKTLAVIDALGTILDAQTPKLVMIDVATGKAKQEIELTGLEGANTISAIGNVCGAFSKDGRYVTGVLYLGDNFLGYSRWSLFMADLQEGTVKMIHTEEMDYRYGANPFTIGVQFIKNDASVAVLNYVDDDLNDKDGDDDLDLKGIRLKILGIDGEEQGLFEIPQSLPDKGLSFPYPTTFVAGNEKTILASCAELVMFYFVEEETLGYDRYSTSYVLYADWMNQEEGFITYLTDNGMHYAFYDKKGMAMAGFGDRIHLIKQAVTKDYVINNGEFGICLKPSAVRAAVCDDNLGRIYVQRPHKDEEVTEVEWYQGDGERSVYNLLAVTDLGNGKLCLREGKNDGKTFTVKYVDAATQEVEATYDVDFGDNNPNLAQITPWRDQVHATENSFNKFILWNLKNQSYENVFGDVSVCLKDFCVTKNGDALHAIIGSEYDQASDAWKYALYVRINDGEIKEIPYDESKNWLLGSDLFRDGFIKAGENGYVLMARFTDEEAVDAYDAINAVSGKETVIKDPCPGSRERKLCMGKETAVMAIAEDDNVLRQFSLETGETVREFALPVSAEYVIQIEYCGKDQFIALWSVNRDLYVYDAATGALLFTGRFDLYVENTSRQPCFRSVDDLSRDRLYFVTEVGAAICVNVKSWKKTADFMGLDAFCEETNEIYRVKNGVLDFVEEHNGILRHKAYLLDELIEKAKSSGVK